MTLHSQKKITTRRIIDIIIGMELFSIFFGRHCSFLHFYYSSSFSLSKNHNHNFF